MFNLNSQQSELARKYTPFRDIEPPNFRSLSKSRVFPPVMVYRKYMGNGRTIEWRGQIPGGAGIFNADETFII